LRGSFVDTHIVPPSSKDVSLQEQAQSQASNKLSNGPSSNKTKMSSSQVRSSMEKLPLAKERVTHLDEMTELCEAKPKKNKKKKEEKAA